MAEHLTNILPTISVIVPCYNQAQYLSETLQSVLEQEYRNWECIIVNDGSPDNTEEIAKRWVEKDSRFKYFKKENSGVADTRNYGIKQAQGDYILPLDGDDKIDSKYIQKALEIFNHDNETTLVYSNLILFGAKDEKLILQDYSYKNMLVENQIFVSAIFRRTDFLKTAGFNSNMTAGLEDWDFWLTFLKATDKVVKINEFLFFYRIKENSRSTAINKEKNEDLLLQIFKNHVPLYLGYFNPIRDHIEADFYKKESDMYKKSTEYKVGRIILYPIRFVQKVLHKIFS